MDLSHSIIGNEAGTRPGVFFGMRALPFLGPLDDCVTNRRQRKAADKDDE